MTRPRWEYAQGAGVGYGAAMWHFHHWWLAVMLGVIFGAAGLLVFLAIDTLWPPKDARGS